MNGADEHTLVGGHETDDATPPALLESVDAVERVAPRGDLEPLHLWRRAICPECRSELDAAARVGDTEVVPRSRPALLRPADGVPLQGVCRAVLKPLGVRAGGEVSAPAGPFEHQRRADWRAVALSDEQPRGIAE